MNDTLAELTKSELCTSNGKHCWKEEPVLTWLLLIGRFVNIWVNCNHESKEVLHVHIFINSRMSCFHTATNVIPTSNARFGCFTIDSCYAKCDCDCGFSNA